MIGIGDGERGYRLPPVPPLYSSRLRKLPRWAKMWHLRTVIFSFEERTWRVVADGSHNNTPERTRWDYLTRKERRLGMFVAYAIAIPVEVEEKKLAAGSIEQFAKSLVAVQAQGRKFTPDMLRYATHLKWWKA